jgi:predicted acetyltransferase
MKFLTYNEVDAKAAMALSLKCFNWPLAPEDVALIRRIDRSVPDYFAHYIQKGDELIGQVGIMHINTGTKAGDEVIGGIWGVCMHPEYRHVGYGKKLMLEAHRVLEDEGIRIAFLGTGKQLFAHALYEKLGYCDFHDLPTAIRRMKPESPGSEMRLRMREFQPEDEAEVYRHYKQYSSQCTGFTRRPENFLEVRKSWSWMPTETPQLFELDGEVVGYAMYHTKPRTLAILEMVVEETLLEEAIGLLESKYESVAEYTEIRDCVHEDRRGRLASLGFNVMPWSWDSMMVAPIDQKMTIEDIRALYGIDTDCFHMTEVDAF